LEYKDLMELKDIYFFGLKEPEVNSLIIQKIIN